MNFELEKQHYDQHSFVIVRQLLGDKDFTELKENNKETSSCDLPSC